MALMSSNMQSQIGSADTSLPRLQKAIIQQCCQEQQGKPSSNTLSLQIKEDVPVPALLSPHDVLVRVLAVALNHCDYKMPINFPAAGCMVGCDFCGVVVARGPEATHELGTRVCGAVFPYSSLPPAAPNTTEEVEGSVQHSGAFAQFVAVDSRLTLRVPNVWSDIQGAALGAVGWGTVGLALSDPRALGLDGFPSAPSAECEPVLIYGGGTATGTMACQLLNLSGYKPIAATSPQSSALALQYGASVTVSYTSVSCPDEARNYAAEKSEPIRHALDYITSAESAAVCFAALARTGGRYACLESFSAEWRTRRAVTVKIVMGYEGLGRGTQLESSRKGGGEQISKTSKTSGKPAATTTYTRKANLELAAFCARWAKEMQRLLDTGSVKHHPIREVIGSADADDDWAKAIIDGLQMLQRGEVRGSKLVIRVIHSL